MSTRRFGWPKFVYSGRQTSSALESASSAVPGGAGHRRGLCKLPALRLTTQRPDEPDQPPHPHPRGAADRGLVTSSGRARIPFTLATGAARDCGHSQHQASDIQMLISTSITRSEAGPRMPFEPR